MRADNTRHIITAAHQRHELTRAKAIQALRTIDAQGAPVTFQTVAQAAAVSRSWLYAQPDIRPRSNASALPTVGRRRHRSRLGSDPRTPPCCTGSRPPHNGSGSWARRTASSESNSPKPSANNAPR